MDATEASLATCSLIKTITICASVLITPLPRAPLIPCLILDFLFNFFPLFVLISRSETLRLILASSGLGDSARRELVPEGEGRWCPEGQWAAPAVQARGPGAVLLDLSLSFFKINLFIFIFGCVGSLLLRVGFL